MKRVMSFMKALTGPPCPGKFERNPTGSIICKNGSRMFQTHLDMDYCGEVNDT